MTSDQTTTSTRRRLLGTAAGATGLALAATALRASPAVAMVPGTVSNMPSAGGGRSFTGGRVGLDVQGVAQGFLKSADGGDTYADVIATPIDGGGFDKQLGQVKYEEFSLEFGFGMGIDFNTWVVNSTGGSQPTRHDGAVVVSDLNGAIRSARTFHNGLITQLAIPACNASSRGTGVLTVGVAPETASDVARSGQLSGTTQKEWSTSSFKLEIDGLDCTKVSKIDSITMRQLRDSQGDPTRMDYSDLSITFAASSLLTWKTWFNDFVINGNNGFAGEKNGRLTLLGTDHVTELAVLQLHQLGIHKLDPDPEPVAGQDSTPRAQATLYVQAMNFSKLGSYVLT